MQTIYLGLYLLTKVKHYDDMVSYASIYNQRPIEHIIPSHCIWFSCIFDAVFYFIIIYNYGSI